MKTSSFFDDFNLSVNKKAIFEQFSHEGNGISQNDRISILAKIVCANYDLHKIINQYLESKVAISDKARISEITNTINGCSDDVLDSITDLESKSEQLIALYVKFYKEDYRPERLDIAISFFSEIVKEVYSVEELMKAFLQNELERYKTISFVLGIDLDDDLTEKLRIIDLQEGNHSLWKYTELYSWFINSLLPDVRKNNISYWSPSYEMPAVQIYNVFIKKYFPIEDHDELKKNDTFRKERLFDIVVKIVKVLWQIEPLFDEPVYLVRCNYSLESASEIPYLYENNIVSICIQNDEDKDQEYYNGLINGAKHSFIKSLSYIQRFISLANLAKSCDVIVIASYVGKLPKIGLIKKGSEVFCIEKDNFNLYCLKMKSVYCTPKWGEQLNSIDLSSYPILKSIIPWQATISAINQRRNAVYGIYYGAKYPLDLTQLSNSAIETMCTEWLRSRFAEEPLRICYQLIRTGGNFSDVDILGVNNQNEVVAAQVTNSIDINLVSKKIDKLNMFSSEQKAIFSMVNRPDLEYIDGCRNIFIGNVWKDFFDDSFYKKMLERLVTL